MYTIYTINTLYTLIQCILNITPVHMCAYNPVEQWEVISLHIAS